MLRFQSPEEIEKMEKELEELETEATVSSTWNVTCTNMNLGSVD